MRSAKFFLILFFKNLAARQNCLQKQRYSKYCRNVHWVIIFSLFEIQKTNHKEKDFPAFYDKIGWSLKNKFLRYIKQNLSFSINNLNSLQNIFFSLFSVSSLLSSYLSLPLPISLSISLPPSFSLSLYFLRSILLFLSASTYVCLCVSSSLPHRISSEVIILNTIKNNMIDPPANYSNFLLMSVLWNFIPLIQFLLLRTN